MKLMVTARWTALLFLLTACSGRTYEKIYPTLSDGRYDSEFPYRYCSMQLDTISRSIFKVFCLVDYKTYLLDPADRLLPADISLEKLYTATTETVKSNEASTGTATLVYYADNRIMLLTCAHIFSYPDTLFSYAIDNDPYSRDYLQGVSIKERQLIFFRGYPEGNSLEILASDESRDLALIGRNTGGNISNLQVFPYKLGHSEELEWGSFVYMMGFPMGYEMITRGIISRTQPFPEESFLVDAVVNEGFSGSIVLGVRDGVPNFELVGLGKSASATYEHVMVPEDPGVDMKYNPNVPYDGKLFVDRRTSLNYGVTYGISTSAIRKFYREHREKLEGLGYGASSFFE